MLNDDQQLYRQIADFIGQNKLTSKQAARVFKALQERINAKETCLRPNCTAEIEEQRNGFNICANGHETRARGLDE